MDGVSNGYTTNVSLPSQTSKDKTAGGMAEAEVCTGGLGAHSPSLGAVDCCVDDHVSSFLSKAATS